MIIVKNLSEETIYLFTAFVRRRVIKLKFIFGLASLNTKVYNNFSLFIIYSGSFQCQ